MSQELTNMDNENLNVIDAGFFSTINGEDTATRAKVYNAISDAENLSDHLNEPITIKDIIVQRVQIADEQTGEVVEAPRVILIDDKGKAFGAISKGIMTSVQSLISIMGEPSTWDSPVKFKAQEVKTRRGFKVMKLVVA